MSKQHMRGGQRTTNQDILERNADMHGPKVKKMQKRTDNLDLGLLTHPGILDDRAKDVIAEG